MAIETLEEWNDLITSYGYESCCSCEIQGQDGIQSEGENIVGFIQVQGFSNGGNLYQQKVVSWSDGGTSTQTYDSQYGCELGGDVIEALGSITTVDVPPLTGTPTTSYNTLIDIEAAFSAGRTAADAAVDWATMDLTAGAGSADYTNSATNYRYISYNRTRFAKADFARSTDIGTYLKVTFDVVDFFEDATDAVVSTADTLEWTGTFDLGDYTNPANFTDWFYINPPTYPGVRSIKNFVCTKYQTTRYGNKPQTQESDGAPITGFGTYP